LHSFFSIERLFGWCVLHNGAAKAEKNHKQPLSELAETPQAKDPEQPKTQGDLAPPPVKADPVEYSFLDRTDRVRPGKQRGDYWTDYRNLAPDFDLYFVQRIRNAARRD
jgi:hypothetical protein